MKEFHNFRKSSSINENIVEVNRLEETGDALTAGRSAASIPPAASPSSSWSGGTCSTGWKKCCDACEHVANIMESIIMKNS